MRLAVAALPLLVAGLALAAIYAPASDDPELQHYECRAPDPDWQQSPYRLPYAPGTKNYLLQGNCSGHGHKRFWLHGYDFEMPIGTPVHAARSGTVVRANDGCKDGDRSCTNLLLVRHDDGTHALYSHLTPGGVLAGVGAPVLAGQLIGRSGDTGNTGGRPHLHFSVHPCASLPGLPRAERECASRPFGFSNTTPNPAGLRAGYHYLAQ